MANPNILLLIGEPLNYNYRVLDVPGRMAIEPITVAEVYAAAQQERALLVEDGTGKKARMIFARGTVVGCSEQDD